MLTMLFVRVRPLYTNVKPNTEPTSVKGAGPEQELEINPPFEVLAASAGVLHLPDAR